MPGLVSLRVLHSVSFRPEDPCPWWPREFKKLVVDIVAHNPSMKLEYIALDANIDRLVHRKQKPKSEKVDKKGKGKAWSKENVTKQVMEELFGIASSSPTLGDGGLDGMATSFDWQESSDDDELGSIAATGLKVEVIENVRFCDISGVRIFEKDILGGRL